LYDLVSNGKVVLTWGPSTDVFKECGEPISSFLNLPAFFQQQQTFVSYIALATYLEGAMEREGQRTTSSLMGE